MLHHTEMQKTLKDLLDQQSKAERIKNFPYPRQYARINTIFVWCFAGLLPFCVINEFDRLNAGVSGLLAGQMAWLAIPFSALGVLDVRVPRPGRREHGEPFRRSGERRSDLLPALPVRHDIVL